MVPKRRNNVEQLTAVGLLPGFRLLHLELAEKPPLRLEPVDVGEAQREAVEVDVRDNFEAKSFPDADDVAFKPKAKNSINFNKLFRDLAKPCERRRAFISVYFWPPTTILFFNTGYPIFVHKTLCGLIEATLQMTTGGTNQA